MFTGRIRAFFQFVGNVWVFKDLLNRSTNTDPKTGKHNSIIRREILSIPTDLELNWRKDHSRSDSEISENENEYGKGGSNRLYYDSIL